MSSILSELGLFEYRGCAGGQADAIRVGASGGRGGGRLGQGGGGAIVRDKLAEQQERQRQQQQQQQTAYRHERGRRPGRRSGSSPSCSFPWRGAETTTMIPEPCRRVPDPRPPRRTCKRWFR